MTMKLYAVCPEGFDVFYTGWESERKGLSQLDDCVYVVPCRCCGETHTYRRKDFIAVKLPHKKQPKTQPAEAPC